MPEAPRWAPTWGERQPVRFVVGVRGDTTFEALSGLLKRGNSYAKAASALILLCADECEDERTKLYSGVDAGAAAPFATGRGSQPPSLSRLTSFSGSSLRTCNEA